MCGMNPFGRKYCPNIFTPTYTTLLFQVTSKFGMTCHTKDRHSIYDCFMKVILEEFQQTQDEQKHKEDTALLNKFIIEYYEREENNNVRDNDMCMKSHSKVSQYWEARENNQEKINPNYH